MEQNRSAGGDWSRERPNICVWMLGEEGKHNAATADVRWRPSKEIKPLHPETETKGEKKLTRRRAWTRRWPAASCSPSWGSWSTSSNSGRSTDGAEMLREGNEDEIKRQNRVKGGFKTELFTPWISAFILKKNFATGFPDSDSISTNSSSCFGILILLTWEREREGDQEIHWPK